MNTMIQESKVARAIPMAQAALDAKLSHGSRVRMIRAALKMLKGVAED